MGKSLEDSFETKNTDQLANQFLSKRALYFKSQRTGVPRHRRRLLPMNMRAGGMPDRI